jgi:hypothetical protein
VLVVLSYRGREVRLDDVAFIRRMIADHPQASRRLLSRRICEAWGWVQANGALRDAVCRGLMLVLHRAGHITLPPARRVQQWPIARRLPPARVDVPALPIAVPLSDLGPVEIRQVRRTPDEALVNSLVAQHHYLGYVHPVGEHLKYLVTARRQPIACFCWSSAPRHLGPRDIGWSPSVRKANLRFVAYQSRFLILPWIHVPHLASHLLGSVSRRLSSDWERTYAHPIYFAETFVDPSRYRGTCYRAANWTYLGMTKGRGKDDLTRRPNRSLKQVLGYALVKDFRRHLLGRPEAKPRKALGVGTLVHPGGSDG